jgi:starch synthase
MDLQGSLKILYVATEVEPFVKGGRMGEIANHLPKSLLKRGNDIRVVMPRYKSISENLEYVTDFSLKTGSRKDTCIVRKLAMKSPYENQDTNITIYFLDNYHYFDRDKIYGYFDDGERFSFFSMAVLKMLAHIMFKPDIIHCNEWHTGIISMILKENYRGQFFYKDIKTVFSIQKLKHQGHFEEALLEYIGISRAVFTPEKAEFYGKINFMKIGIVYSDYIVFNSDTYAKAVLEKEYGEGLNDVLRAKSKNIYSITNGISYDEYNPEMDPELKQNYGLNNIEKKLINKYQLQDEVGLPRSDVPLIAIVSKLNKKKGFELIFENIDEFMKMDMQLIAIGEGLADYEDKFKEIQNKYFNRVSVFIGDNMSLAKRIFAGSDILLVPSKIEACGVNQIIGLRYGTIPIARSTGALAETVINVKENPEKGNGFKFENFEVGEFIQTVKEACELFKNDKKTWNNIIKNAMTSSFSWDESSEKFENLYAKIVKHHNSPALV